MSQYSSRNHYDLGFQHHNDQYGWTFDWDQYEVSGSSSHQISNRSIFSRNTIDCDFGQINEHFHWTGERQLPEVDSIGSYQFRSSSENLDPPLRNHNERFFWEEDRRQSVGVFGYKVSDIFSEDSFDWVFKKLKDLFSWVGSFLSDIVSGSRGHHAHRHCNCHLRNGNSLHGIRHENTFSRPTKPWSVNDVNKINSLGQSTCVPVEPECENEDLYSRCRKDARKMESVADDYRKASKVARSKGDKILAKELDKKARETDNAAKKLHEEASHKIFKENNKDYGIMKMDLHDLHVPEAIQFVEKRLNEIGKLSKKAIGKLNQQRLEVVTGIGNHSRGAPKLPGAVRSFLNENGYEFDGNKPGVVMVHPKFRHI